MFFEKCGKKFILYITLLYIFNVLRVDVLFVPVNLSSLYFFQLKHTRNEYGSL